MDVGLLAAFAGGMLALLSPCAALLLPAFFASTVGAGGRLLIHGAVFYVGLLITLLPIGIGVGALASVVAQHRAAIIAVASVVIVLLGVLQIFGRGFDLSNAIPGFDRMRAESARRSGWSKTLLLGAVSGVAGFCTGPILGAVLTMAASRGLTGAGVLLGVYAAGMVVPMLVIALVWRRFGEVGRGMLRGRTITVAGRQLHTTNLVTGALLIIVGVAFWFTNGFIGVPDPVDLNTQDRLQEAASTLANPVVDVLVIVAIAGGILVWWARRRSRLA